MIKRKITVLKSSAKNRGLFLKLSKHEYEQLIDLGCSYCGCEIKNSGGCSLDRLDSNKDYTFDNVVPCCKICNVAKNNMPVEDFFDWIDRVYNFKQKQLQLVEELNWSEKEFKKHTNEFLNTKQNRNSENI